MITVTLTIYLISLLALKIANPSDEDTWICLYLYTSGTILMLIGISL